MSKKSKYRIGLLLFLVPIATIFAIAIIFGGWAYALIIAAIISLVAGSYLALDNLE